jgi:hypothetical protein
MGGSQKYRLGIEICLCWIWNTDKTDLYGFYITPNKSKFPPIGLNQKNPYSSVLSVFQKRGDQPPRNKTGRNRKALRVG